MLKNPFLNKIFIIFEKLGKFYKKVFEIFLNIFENFLNIFEIFLENFWKFFGYTLKMFWKSVSPRKKILATPKVIYIYIYIYIYVYIYIYYAAVIYISQLQLWWCCNSSKLWCCNESAIRASQLQLCKCNCDARIAEMFIYMQIARDHLKNFVFTGPSSDFRGDFSQSARS